MTLVELALALGVLTVAVGGLLHVLALVNIGHERIWHRGQAWQTAHRVAEDVLRCNDNWEALCTEYDAQDGVDVVVQDGDGDPGSGWAKITVRVQFPADAGSDAQSAKIVFGKAE